VPLEALHPASARAELLEAVLDEAGVASIPDSGCGGGGDDVGGDTDAGPTDTVSTDTAVASDTVATDSVAPDGVSVDTVVPTDTVTFPDVMIGDVSDGTAVLPPYREVRQEERETGGGCAGGEPGASWLFAGLLVALVARRRRRARV